jgi:hypothetical protein
MTNLVPPVGWADIATKHDLAELETRLDGKLDRLETRLTQRFVTWLLLSQAAVIAAVGALLAVM